MSRAAATGRRYGEIARDYRRFFAPALVAFARPLVRTVPLANGAEALDLGSGVGTISALLARRGAAVTGIDASEGMLRESRGLARVRGDVYRLPFGDGTFDAALCTFVLHHLARPGRLVAEAVRVLRPGGMLATVTWGPFERPGPAIRAVERVLRRHRVPPEPPPVTPVYHRLTDAPAKMRRYAHGVGFRGCDAWEARGEYRFTHDGFVSYVTRIGPRGRVIAGLPDGKRARIADEIAAALGGLEPDDLTWRPALVYCLATR